MKQKVKRITAMLAALSVCGGTLLYFPQDTFSDMYEIKVSAFENQYVAIDETNFPDPIFRSYVDENFDTTDDDKLTLDEYSIIYSIDVSGMGISDLTGVTHFPYLTDLFCDNNQLTSLDVNGCTCLNILSCSNNQITDLCIDECTSLYHLNCSENELTTINVSTNASLSELACGSNSLEALDLSQNASLTYLSCGANNMNTLDVSLNPNLTTLVCRGVRDCSPLQNLVLGQNDQLKTIDCAYNQIISLDVSGCPALETLSCQHNQLIGLDLSQNTVLSNLEWNPNSYTITLTDGTYDISMLPVSLDTAKVTEWINAALDGSQLTILNPAKPISYVYDTGYSEAVEFALAPDSCPITADMIGRIDPMYCMGEPLEPAFSVSSGDVTLLEGEDYEVEYSNNTDIGRATVTVKAIGDFYTGEATTTFVIYPASLSYDTTYGDTLADIPLPDDFTWQEDPETFVGNVGYNNFYVTYTPEDAKEYEIIQDIPVIVVVEKATPDYTVPDGLTAVYGTSLLDISLPDGFSWEMDGSDSIGDPGEHEFFVTYTPEDTENYQIVENISVILTVEKAVPEYEIPQDLSAAYGDTLADIALPEGFSWQDDESTAVGNAGTNTFYVTYTPENTIGYEIIKDIAVEIVVQKAFLNITLPALSAVFGDTLADVALPEGFAWVDDPSTPVCNEMGESCFIITYTPEDGMENYDYYKGQYTDEFVYTEVWIDVAKVVPEYEVPIGLSASYGDTLAQVALPDGFRWQDDHTTSVGEPGKNVFLVTYISDHVMHERVNDIEVTITVRGIPEYTVPTDLTAFYGDTLADVVLPEGFSWQDDEATSVGNGNSVSCFYVTYTPEDTENYDIVTDIEVILSVLPADPIVNPVVSEDIFFEGDPIPEIHFSEGDTSGWLSWTVDIYSLLPGINTLGWHFTPENHDNYNEMTGIMVLYAETTTTTTQTTTTTTTQATTTTTETTTTTTEPQPPTFSDEEEDLIMRSIDVDGDGRFNMIDLLRILEFVCKHISLPVSIEPVEGIVYGDANLDGVTNMTDVIILERVLMEGIKFTPAQSDPEGDPELTLLFESVTAAPGEEVEINLYIDHFTGESIYGVDLNFSMSTVLKNLGFTIPWTDRMMGNYNTPENKLAAYAISDTGLTEGSLLATILVKVPETAQRDDVFNIDISSGCAAYNLKYNNLCDVQSIAGSIFVEEDILTTPPPETTSEILTSETTVAPTETTLTETTAESTTTETTTTETTTKETTTTETTTTEFMTSESTETTITTETTSETTAEIIYGEDEESFDAVIVIPEDKTPEKLEILTNGVNAVFDAEAVLIIHENYADQKITMHYEILTESPNDNQNETFEEILNDGGKLFDLSLMDENGESVAFSNESVSGSVTIMLPYSAVDSNSIVHVYYIAEDGTLTDMNGTYDTEMRFVSFATTHFSVYAIVEEIPSETTAETSTETTTTTTTTTTLPQTSASETTETETAASSNEPATETTASSTESDLPQTGGNAVHSMLILFFASVLTGTGGWMIWHSGMFRRKRSK